MKIGEVAKQYDLSEDSLRYYEKIGIMNPHRNESGIRDYNEDDLKRVQFVKCMRKAGLSIEFLCKYIQLFEQGDETFNERKELLIKQKEILVAKKEEIDETLALLNYKIDNYEKLGVKNYGKK